VGGDLERGMHPDLLTEDKHSSIAQDNDFIGPYTHNVYVHRACAIWAPRVFIDQQLNIKHVDQEIQRAQLIRCAHCRKSGAAIGCFRPECPRSFHLPCAKHEALCYLDHDRFILVCRYCFVKYFYAQFPDLNILHTQSALQKYIFLKGKHNQEQQHVQLEGIAPIGLEKEYSELLRAFVTPLLYPELFDSLGIQPHKGIILHGPPGCGKTSLFRAFAKEMEESAISYKGKRVKIFSHSASDLLSKFYGETERNIRNLFIKAKELQPAIIFFDEFDALAPVRSAKQMQIHSSVVSTLLSVMDGVNGSGKVFVVAATNRIDRIDPALRRPGRFDKEIQVRPLIAADRVRLCKGILDSWKNNSCVSENAIEELMIHRCSGLNGADVSAILSEAIFVAVKRVLPELCDAESKLKPRALKKIKVIDSDLNEAFMRKKDSFCARIQNDNAFPYGSHFAHLFRILLRRPLNEALIHVQNYFSGKLVTQSSLSLPCFLLIHGSKGNGQEILATSIFSMIESYSSVRLIKVDCANLHKSDVHSENIFSSLYSAWNAKFAEFVNTNSIEYVTSNERVRILYLSNFERIWTSTDSSLRALIVRDLLDLHSRAVTSSLPSHFFIIMTVSQNWNGEFVYENGIPIDLIRLFSHSKIECGSPGIVLFSVIFFLIPNF
jgi:SpoVK/Ycf46/Vps4 family AAA+-type ATPase